MGCKIYSFALRALMVLFAGLILPSLSGRLIAASYTWNVSGAGNWFVASNWVPTGVPGAADTVTINFGSVDTSPGVSLSGVLIWNGGIIGGSGLTVAVGGAVMLGNNVGKTLYTTVTNRGTITWLDGDVSLYNDNASYFGAIYNQSGGLIDIQCDKTMTGGTGLELVSNLGNFRKSAGTGSTRIQVRHVNPGGSGSVNVQSGTLELNGGGILRNTYMVSPGAALLLTGGAFVCPGTPNFTGTGTRQMIGGSMTLSNSPPIGLTLAGGSLYLAPTFQGGAITNLTLSGITLASAAEVSGVLEWTAGIIASPLTVHSGAVVSVSSAAGKTLYAPLTNRGTINWLDGNIAPYRDGGAYSGSFYNEAGGLMDIQCDRSIGVGTGQELVNNNGVVRKSAGSGTSAIQIALNNSGTVEVQAGSLQLSGGGMVGGTYNVLAGATLNLLGGSFVASGAPLFTGPGTRQMLAGNLTLPSDAISGLNMAGGSLFLGGSFQGGTVTNLTLSGITLASAAEVSGVLDWTAGTIASPLTVRTGAVLNISSLAGKTLYVPLTNRGTINWLEGHIQPYRDGGAYSGSFYNEAGGLMDIQCDRSIGVGTGQELVNNNGVVRKSAGSGTTGIYISFNNSGSVEVQAGTLQLSGGGTVGGSYNVSAGALLNLAGGSFVASGAPLFTGPGTRQMVAGNLTLPNDAISGLSMAGGSLFLGGTFQGGAITNLTLSGITLASAAEVSGVLEWTAGIIASPLTVHSGAVVSVSSAAGKTLYAPLTNRGTINWLDGNIAPYRDGGAYSGSFYNEAGGVLDIQCDRTLVAGTGQEAFNNSGMVRKSSGAGTTIIQLPMQNSGIIQPWSGTLRVANTFTQLGGTLAFQIRSSSDFGRFAVTGNFPASGTVRARINGPYQPASGDLFPLISYGSISGFFSTFDPPPEGRWQQDYSAQTYGVKVLSSNSLSLTVTNAADSGPGTLRDAIELANSSPGLDSILFALPIGGTVLSPLSPLPPIIDSLVLDGFSQAGSSYLPVLSPVVQIDGQNLRGAAGVILATSNCVVQGLGFVRFTNGPAVLVTGTSATSNSVRGNVIGLRLSDRVAQPNAFGIVITNGASENLIGQMQSVPGSIPGNVLAGNTGTAVIIGQDCARNRILRNSTYTNGGLGIDLGADGVTVNRFDGSGPAPLQDFPVLQSAIVTTGVLHLTGTFNALAGKAYHLEFFSSPSADPSGHGEGQKFLGHADLLTLFTEVASFEVSLATNVTLGEFITATATEEGANTSEFSHAFPVGGVPSIIGQPVGATVSRGESVTFCITAAGGNPLHYQWRLNGINISGATNACLTITNVQLSNAGSYEVVVVNETGYLVSNPAVLVIDVPALPPGDMFADRVLISGTLGAISGSNTTATFETDEPNPVGKSGGHSVWYVWQAPASGIATFSTEGSSFDTLLGVYNGNNVSGLATIVSDEDSGGSLSSLVRFNVQAGTSYNVQIDGLLGAAGSFVLSWNLRETTNQLPVLTTPPSSQTVTPGAAHTFAATVQNGAGQNLFQWFLNGIVIAGATNATLTVSNIQPANLGLYKVQITAGEESVLSAPVSLQINSTESQFEPVQAYDKLSDVLVTTNLLVLGNTAGPGFLARPKSSGTITRGYTGTQIFSTFGATSDPNEPPICGVIGGASTWIKFLPEERGRLYLNTDGSSYDTLIAVYTSGAGGTLHLLGCDNNSGVDGHDSSLNVPVEAGKTNFIVVDGVAGAIGNLTLNYSLVNPSLLVSLGKTSGGAYHLQVNGRPGMKLSLQRSQNLQTWTTLTTVTNLTSTFDFIDLQSVGQSGGFYRALMLP